MTGRYRLSYDPNKHSHDYVKSILTERGIEEMLESEKRHFFAIMTSEEEAQRIGDLEGITISLDRQVNFD